MKWGWLIAIIAVGIIVWLVLRPPATPDNSRQQHYVDSLLGSNGQLRSDVELQYNDHLRYKDSATRVIDSLEGRNTEIKTHANIVLAQNLSLARKIQYYQQINDTEQFDSSCLVLASRVIDDSVLIQDYQHNTDKIINSFGDLVNHQDSLIMAQHGLILNDSLTIIAQKDLNQTQAKEITRLVKRGKITTWIGRSLAVVAAVLTIGLLTK